MFYHHNRSSEPQVWHLTQNSLAYHIEQLSMTKESQHPNSQYKSKFVRYTYVYICVCLFLCFSLYSYYMRVNLWFVFFICGLLYLTVDVGFFLDSLCQFLCWVIIRFIASPNLYLPTADSCQLARLIPTTVEGIPVCSWDCWNMNLAMLCVHFTFSIITIIFSHRL
jgi:hypothetical protein